MTDPETATPRTYGRDYWDLVLSQLLKKPSVLVSVPLLVLIYAVAIYAPFLANDRPLLLEGVDVAGYRRAQTSLRPICLNLKGMVRDGRPAYEQRQAELVAARAEAEQRAEAQAVSWEQALAAEASAIGQRLDTMADQLLPGDRGLLDEVRAALAQTVALAAGEDPGAEEAAGRLSDLSKRVRSEMGAADPSADAGSEDGEGLALQPRRLYPALENVSRAELYFMLLWLAVMTWPVWNPLINRVLLRGDVERIRHQRRRKAWAVVLLPALPLLFWTSPEDGFETGPFKVALTNGDMVATRAVFPPVAFGYAEVNDAEYFRPPTWKADASISEEGYYESGARAAALDDVAGFRPPPKPVAVRAGEPERNAAGRHPLGTDSLGRDLVARMVWGARVSLSVGLVSTVFLVIIGIILGALAGYHHGWIDVIISRVIEIVQCFPVFFLILMVVAFTRQQGILPIMVVIGIFRWTGVARLVRGEFIRLRHQDFVVASEALGVPNRRTIFRHMLPNALGPVLVAATFSVAAGILIESSLSFLGFGIQLPIPSWGSLINESRSAEHWWIQIFPGLFIFLTVMLYNLLGEGVRDALDPRIKKA